MQWPDVMDGIVAGKADLISTCDPTNAFLREYSRIFHTCVPTPLAFASNTLGALSILAWLFAQLPQIYKNWRISSTSGLSIIFLAEWCLGDISNLLGALFTHQAPWQVCIGGYYVFVDLCLVGQWIWYERLRHGNRTWTLRRKRPQWQDPWQGDRHSPAPQTAMQGTRAEDETKTSPRMILRMPTFSDSTDSREKPSSSWYSMSFNRPTVNRTGGSSSPLVSPRTILFVACLISLVRASPLSTAPTSPPPVTTSQHTFLETIGTLFSWLSTLLYLLSRIPQLLKNYQRKSTAGLSPQLFAAAFLGNLLYSAALATNPNAWHDFEPYGGNGWAGPNGSRRDVWIAAALPFFLGASGVLIMDASVGVQFLLYGEGSSSKEVVVVSGTASTGYETRELRASRPGPWRRVSGWMRGWVPNVAVLAPKAGGSNEQRPLLVPTSDGALIASTTNHGRTYGGV